MRREEHRLPAGGEVCCTSGDYSRPLNFHNNDATQLLNQRQLQQSSTTDCYSVVLALLLLGTPPLGAFRPTTTPAILPLLCRTAFCVMCRCS